MDIKDSDDARVIELCRLAGFFHKCPTRLPPLEAVCTRNFDGDFPVESRVPSEIHRRKTTMPYRTS